jgi:hypothetical protein
MEAMLDRLDWAAIGANAEKMRPLLADLLAGIQAKKPMSPEVIGRIQTLNGPLLTAALQLEEDLDTGHVNTAFTHPAFMSNAIAATLTAAGLPLTSEQEKALADIGLRYTEEEKRRAASYGPEAFQLRRILDEAALRQRFFDEVESHLTAEQRAALGDPTVRGRVQLDLFSSGLVWTGRCAVLTFRDVDGLVAAFAERLVTSLHLALDEAAREDLRRLIAEWLRGWPVAALETPADPASLSGMVTVAYAMDCARRELALLEGLQSALSLDAKGVESLRSAQAVLLPARLP